MPSRPQRRRSGVAVPLLVLVAVGLLVSACGGTDTATPSATTGAPATIAPPPDDDVRQASAQVDCGSDPNESSRQRVTVVNRTDSTVRIATSAIDCYDWGGTANPSLLDGLQLAAGQSSPNETFVVRGVPQANLQIRPWDMAVQYWGGTQWLSTDVVPRPTFGAAEGNCNTASGMTACMGESLCGEPDFLERRTEMPLSAGFGSFVDSGKRLVVTTYCSLTDQQARIVLTIA